MSPVRHGHHNDQGLACTYIKLYRAGFISRGGGGGGGGGWIVHGNMTFRGVKSLRGGGGGGGGGGEETLKDVFQNTMQKRSRAYDDIIITAYMWVSFTVLTLIHREWLSWQYLPQWYQQCWHWSAATPSGGGNNRCEMRLLHTVILAWWYDAAYLWWCSLPVVMQPTCGDATYLWWHQCKVLWVVVSDGYIVHCIG